MTPLTPTERQIILRRLKYSRRRPNEDLASFVLRIRDEVLQATAKQKEKM
jgi:hypothetical protein